MSRRRRNRGEARVDVNLTPLLDIVLQLITFFMMLVHFGTQIEGASAEVRLPVAPAGLPGTEMQIDRLVATIDARGALLVEGKGLVGRAAGAWWAEQAERRRAGQETLGGPAAELPTRVILRADKDAPYGAVRTALVEAQGRGFAHFSLVVLRSLR
jgi:biopolymer transport protein ExbD